MLTATKIAFSLRLKDTPSSGRAATGRSSTCGEIIIRLSGSVNPATSIPAEISSSNHSANFPASPPTVARGRTKTANGTSAFPRRFVRPDFFSLSMRTCSRLVRGILPSRKILGLPRPLVSLGVTAERPRVGLALSPQAGRQTFTVTVGSTLAWPTAPLARTGCVVTPSRQRTGAQLNSGSPTPSPPSVPRAGP